MAYSSQKRSYIIPFHNFNRVIVNVGVCKSTSKACHVMGVRMVLRRGDISGGV